jgi:hypothetical protein
MLQREQHSAAYGLLVAANLLVLLGGCGAKENDVADSHRKMSEEGLVFEPKELRFERSVEDPLIRTVKVELRNTTDRAIEIVDVKGTCVCAVADALPHAVIAAGKAMNILIKLTFPNAGEKSSSIYVSSSACPNAARLPVCLIAPPEEIPRIVYHPREILVTCADYGDSVITGLGTVTAKEYANEAGWLESAEIEGAPNVAVEVFALSPEVSAKKDVIMRSYELRVRGERSEVAEGTFPIRLYGRPVAGSRETFDVDLKARCSFRSPPFRLRPSVVVLKDSERETQVVQLLGLGDLTARVDLSEKPDWVEVSYSDSSNPQVIGEWEMELPTRFR